MALPRTKKNLTWFYGTHCKPEGVSYSSRLRRDELQSELRVRR
jgi:hypothetical protein